MTKPKMKLITKPPKPRFDDPCMEWLLDEARLSAELLRCATCNELIFHGWQVKILKYGIEQVRQKINRANNHYLGWDE